MTSCLKSIKGLDARSDLISGKFSIWVMHRGFKSGDLIAKVDVTMYFLIQYWQYWQVRDNAERRWITFCAKSRFSADSLEMGNYVKSLDLCMNWTQKSYKKTYLGIIFSEQQGIDFTWFHRISGDFLLIVIMAATAAAQQVFFWNKLGDVLQYDRLELQ